MKKTEATPRGAPTFYGERMVSDCTRMTQAQREKKARLGGAAWMREMIDSAPEPKPKTRKK